MTYLRFLRAYRIVLLVLLAVNVAFGILNAVAGRHFALVSFAAAALLVAGIAFQARTIRRRAEQLRPRPDYAAIARMEREIWGEAFEHAGAPQQGTGTLTATAVPAATAAFAGTGSLTAAAQQWRRLDGTPAPHPPSADTQQWLEKDRWTGDSDGNIRWTARGE